MHLMQVRDTEAGGHGFNGAVGEGEGGATWASQEAHPLATGVSSQRGKSQRTWVPFSTVTLPGTNNLTEEETDPSHCLYAWQGSTRTQDC